MHYAYYNEWEPAAAAWIEALIDEKVIMPGVVDTRSIEDVLPSDLKGFTRVHFFAGIGTWDYALTLAGWPVDRPVWTGSCPCQPFSAAGKRTGTADERHLWPAFNWLIRQCAPRDVLGEQVASKDGQAWLDDVQADLENSGFAVGAVVTPAAGYGAPHERHRTHFVAVADDDSGSSRQGGAIRAGGTQRSPTEPWGGSSGGGVVERMGHAGSERRGGRQGFSARGVDDRTDAGWVESNDGLGGDVQVGVQRMVDAHGGDARTERQQRSGEHGQQPEDDGLGGLADDERQGPQGSAVNAVPGPGRREEGDGVGRRSVGLAGVAGVPGSTNGFWRDADWLRCRDERWRPVEPGTFPLAHGVAARMGLLRGYGNGIVLPQAVAFVESFLECEAEFRGLRGL